MVPSLILSYHTVSRSWTSQLAVRPECFEDQLGVLTRRRYRPATVHDAVHGASKDHPVAISFDDGYRSNLTVAFPIMERLGFVGTVFVPTDFPEHERPMSWHGIEQWLGTEEKAELCPLSWEDLRTLVAAGWEIGAHGCSHPDLCELSDSELQRELRASRERLEDELGRPCRSLAYPYGSYDERVLRCVRQVGYATACAVPAGRTTLGPLTYPRIGIYRMDGPLSFRVKISPAVRRVRATPAASVLLPLVRLQRAATRTEERPALDM